MRTRWFNFLVLLSLVLGLLPVTAAQAASETTPVAQPAAQAGADIEVESALRNQLAADETTGYLIYFKEKPDLSPAYKMDWIERGRFVANTLNQAALRSQRNVRAYLDAQGIAYKAFWIQNVISVESSNRATVNRLLTFPEIEALRQHRQISLVEPQKTTMAPSAPQAIEPNILHVLADQVWAQGYTGEGIVVASVDTGVRYTHQALVNHYRGNQGGSFNHNYSWWDPYGDHPTEPGDDNGHGSHTMGTMVGDDGGANQIGMAPGAKWMACRGCSTSSCGDVELLECAQFFAAPWDLTKSNANPDMRPNVVNNSWGDCSTSYDPWYQDVVDAWHAAGIYPVFSNGNASNCGYSSPPGLNTVGNPARYGNVTGVGSTGRDNGQYAPHSNWGPTDNPDTVNPHPGWANLKPQVLAPGVNIRSSINSGDSAYEGGWGGTSMSAPHVTGLIALMWQAAPCLVGDYTTTETILENTATPIPYDDGTGGGAHVPNYAAGWGEINALAAVEAAAASCGDSTIAGQVTNSATSAPVAGATVWATSTTDQRKTASDANGFYALNVFSDTYTLTASRYGYQTRVIPGVGATTGATTTQNIVLTPAAYYEVSGQVTDAATGWPLYAHIRITGDPFDPVAPNNAVWTDPATGAYSVMLAEGITYTFQVAAWAPGYNAAPDDVGPLTTDATANFALQANTGTCTAPGYYFVDGMMANFEDDAFPPAGWTVVNNGGSCEWAGDDPGGNGNLTGGTGKFAVADSDACGSGTTMNTDLISPPFDVSGLSQVNLSFAYDYNNYTTGEVAAVDVSANGGATWVNVVTWTTDQRGPATFSQNVTALLAGSTQARVRFHYLAPSWDWWWEVDDVVLGNPVCVAPTDGGLVVGNIYDGNYPTVALNGATVVNAAGGKTTAMATPLDVAVDDAFYTLFAPSGAQVFTATLKGYHPDVATVTVLDAATVEQDFQLPAGLLVATPDGVAVTVELGFTDNATLNLGNTGGAAATFELKEHEGRFAPIHIQAYTGNLPADDALVSTGLAPRKAALTAETSAPLAFPLADAAPAFAIDLIAGELGTFMSDAPGVWTTIGGIALGGPFAGDFLNGDFSQMYVLDYDANTFYTVDMATGVATAIGPSVPNGFWTGMAGSSDGTLYAASTTGSQSYLYTIDPVTGAPSLVGEITNAPIIIAIAINAEGQMYGVDIGSDVLVAIDPATGAGTVVGSTGFSANYAQGMDFEEESGVLYWAAYGSSGELRIIDTATGASTSVGAFPGGAEVDCLAFATGGAADVLWLAEAPVMGSVPAAGNIPISLDFDAAYVDQPGEYHAELIVKNDTPYGKFNVPVTMTVVAPTSWGKLTGTVIGQGVCDGDPAPLEEAEVLVESVTTGQTRLVTTGVDGVYALWIDQAHSPLTVTVTAPDYFGETGGVVVQQGQTTVVDFDLRILLPCLSYDPADFDVTLPMGDNTVELLTLSNTGAGMAEFEMVEMSGGFVPLNLARMVTIGDPLGNHTLTVNPQPASAPSASWPMPEAVNGLETLTHSVSQNIIAGNSVGCNDGAAHTDNSYLRAFDLPDFGITGGFSVVEVDMGIEMASGGSGVQPVEVYLYTLDGDLLWENLTLIGQASAQISDQDLTHFVIPVTGFAPAGSTLVVEFFTPDGGSGGNLLFVGSNNLGQTAPSYLAAADCGVTQPTDTASIGFPDMHVVMNVTGTTDGGGGGGIPWLTETPISGTIATDTDVLVDLTFDAGVPETMQPGTYYGQLKIASNAANTVPNVPVTLTVEAPATWGKIEGVVTGLGYCDVATPILLEEAEVIVESGTGLVEWALLTDENGAYQLWLDAAHGPLDITIAYPDHVTQVFADVMVTAGGTTVQDAALRWAKPCLSVDPDLFDVTVTLGLSTTLPFSLTNAGAANTAFNLTERNSGSIISRALFQGPAVNASGSAMRLGPTTPRSGPSLTAPAADVIQDGSFEDGTPNSYWNEYSTNFGTPICDLSCGTGTGTGPRTGDFWVWFGGISAYEEGSVDQDVTIPAGSATLSFWLEQIICGSPTDYMQVLIDGEEVFATDGTSSICGALGYSEVVVDVTDYADGGDHNIMFYSESNAGSNIFVDDVALDVIEGVTLGIPWLFENPVSGTVAADSTFVAALTFDASAAVTEVTQPGKYFGTLFVNSSDPINNRIPVPVTMTVMPPATWGKLMGTVTGLGYCDADPAPLAGADVLVESWMTETVMLTTTTTLFAEGFEGTFPPAGWSVTQTGGSTTSAWVNTTGQAYSGSYSAYQNDNLPSGITSWFILPQITVPAGGAELTFWQYENWGSYAIYHGIWVSTASDDPADFVELVEFGAGTEDAWEQVSVDLSAYAGQTVYLAFNYQGSYADEWYVDDVSVTGETASLTDVPISWALTTDVSGTYQVWIDEMYSPVTLTVTYPDHEKDEAIVAVTGQNTTTQDFDLRWLVPCVGADPLALHATLELGATATEALTLTNTGAADADWAIAEAGSDVVWLAESPITGTLVADTGEQIVDVDFDASQVDQPGEYYADLWIDSDDPTSPSVVPVTMTVTPPASWGQLTGHVSSTGHCDVNLAPLPGANVRIESWLTDVNTITVPLVEEGFEGAFPPASWTLTQTGATDDPGWVRTSARAYNGSYSAYHDDAITTGDAIAWLIMPQVTIPAGGAELAFWQNQNYDSYYTYHGIWVSTASVDPADFTEAIELGAGTEDVWEEVTLDLSAYAGQSIYIAFRYEGNWADEWYVDDVAVSYEMQAVTPVYTFNTTADADGMYTYWMPAGSYTVTVTAADHVGDSATVTVPAAGAVAQDFSLTWLGPCVTSIAPSSMEVTVALGMSTTLPLTMTNAGAGGLNFQFMEMDGGFVPMLTMSVQQAVQASTLTWNAEKLAGECAVYQDSILAEPSEALGCYNFVPAPQTFGMQPLAPTDTGYAQDIGYVSDNFVSFALNNFTGQTEVGTSTNAYYGMDFDPSATTLYALNDTTDQLGTINLTTGAFTALVPCAPGGGADNWSGLTIDPITGVFYGSTATALYVINPATGASTLVGNFGTNLMIDIAMNTAGEMYGHDIETDSIYQINPATGAATLIGPTGYGANYAQGMDFDNSDGTLYIFLYQGSGANVYGIVNLTTGAVTPLAVSAPQGEFEGAIQTPGSKPIPWLFEDPESGIVPSVTDGVADITFDAGVSEVAQPGDYFGVLVVNNSDPVWDEFSIPVTMHVTLPETYGQITGTVEGLGPCDDPLTAVPLEGAEVTVESATQTWTRLTDATGGYALWLDESHSPVTITVVVDDYVAAFVTGVSIISGTTTVQNLVLSPEAPCLSVTPADAHVTLSMGMSTTVPIAVVNTGAGALGWKVKEADEGFQILAPSAGGTILVVNDGGGNSSAANAFVMALQNLGYAYSLVSSSSTTGIPAVLTDYAAVLYAGQPSTGAEANQLVAYLDAGGRLLVADNDFGYYMYSHTLYTAYFQATYGADSGSDGPIVGADIMAGINTDISSDPYPDNFSLNGPDAVGIFANTAPRTNWAGSRIERNDYRAVYLAWDFYYAGGSTVGDPVETDIVAATLGWLVGSGVPWLDEDPTNGTVAPEATAPVTLTFDASVPEVTQPGDYYAVLTFEGGDGEVEMPVTMTVEVPATWGKLEGLVQGLGYCNAMTMPLEGAVVFVESTVTTDTWGIEAGADGIYGIWLDEMYSPLTVTIAYEAGYGEQVFTGVEVVSGTTTILDANLLWLQPCVMVTPDALSRSVPMGTTATAQMNLDNLGAVSSAFLVNEANLGFDILGPLAVGGPDAFGYQYADSESAVGPVYGFVDISDVGTPVAMGDNTFVEVPIGFGFKFYGTSAVTPTLYNSVFVNSNGFLSFGAGSTDISPDPLPDPTLPNNLIAVAWDDLKPGVGGTVHVESFGQCPYNPVATTVDACFIAQYTNFVHADDTPAGTFEVILFHTGSILMQYAEVDAPDATTGIEAPLGLDGLDYGAALTDELAICFAYPGEWLDCQSSQVPWLTVEPTEGDVAVGANLALDVTFDAGVPEVSEPGVYKAMLTIITEDPMTPYHYIPVTMTVAQPATMAKLEGVVTGWSQCDAVSATLAGAQVAIATSSGDSFVLTADAVGAYGIWLDLGDTYTVTASHAGYVPVTVVGTVAAAMPPLGVELRADMPCIDVSPTSYDVTLPKDRSTTRMFTIDNTGAGDFAFNNILGSSLWLSVLPKSGVVPADSSVPVTLTFDATGLVAGSVYSTVLEIVHTDPDVARLLVRPVRLTVLDAPQVLVEVVKTVVPADFVLPGELLTYTVVFTNSYDMPLDLTATDPVPANTTYVLGSVSGAAVADPPGNVVTWAGSLEAGASATFSLVVRVNDDVALGTMITNTVTVTANAMPFTGQAVVRVGRVMHTIYLPLVQRNAQ